MVLHAICPDWETYDFELNVLLILVTIPVDELSYASIDNLGWTE